MADGLQTTLELLATSKNEAASAVLIAALDAPQSELREAALRALLRRRSQAGQREVLRRLTAQNTRWREILGEKPGKLSGALRDGLLGSDPQLFEHARQAVVWFREYDLLPALLTTAESGATAQADAAAETMLKLIDALYEELSQPRDYSNRRDPQRVREYILASLEQSTLRFTTHRRKEVLEGFLLLVNRDNATLKRILHDPKHACYLTVIDLLTRGRHGGTIRLLLSFLDDPQAPSSILKIVAHRSDLRFVRHLLDKVADAPSATVLQNVRRLDTIAWVRDDYTLLGELNAEGQQAAVKLIMASGMKRTEVLHSIQYLLLHGLPAARRTAAAALAEFKGAEANALALRAIEDDDPEVQAQIVAQLRARGIPGALQRLMQALDHPHEAVRDAARESLSEFSYHRFAGAFETLDETVQRSTGRLVKKVDPTAIESLSAELASRSRTRRLRGLDMAAAMDAIAELEIDVLRCLRDDDHMIRVAAARALAHCPTATARQALEEALGDSSPPVRFEAAQSLDLQARQWPAAPLADLSPPPTMPGEPTT